jgi:pyruvate kinase
MTRRTKIVCTIGPASGAPDILRAMIAAGMDVARLNFSHGKHEDHRRTLDTVREAAVKEGRVVPVLQDLQGPKIRIGEMKDGSILLHKGQQLRLTTTPLPLSDENLVYVSYPTLVHDVEVGRHILLDDGQLELAIVEKDDETVLTEVVVGGQLRSRKGVNLPHIRTSTPSLTEKDVHDLAFGLTSDVDIIALSFVRNESDVRDLIRRVRESGKRVSVIAKIEKPEAVHRIDNILKEADGIMVARGDLGIEMPLSKVPGTQKSIIQKCLHAGKPVITATQMLESMIENPRPTRAEASDVANAVLDGTDAVMLSGETAMGKYPVRVVEVMAKIVEEAEQNRQHFYRHQPEGSLEVTEAISYTAFEVAEQVQAAAIVCLTASGATARAIARYRPSMPIYAFTDDERVVRQLGLTWGTRTFYIPSQKDTDQGVRLVHRILLEQGLVKWGDLLVITAGMPLPQKGRTNMLHVSRV